jgi:5-formyltetrahydrofolate cyclo-ligase
MAAARRHLAPGERRERSARIAAALRGLPAFRDAAVVCSYVSYREEVETREVIAALLAAGRRVAVPAHLHGTGHPLVFAEIAALDELVPNHFGILQPALDRLRIVPTGAIPLFLVPGLAFDPAGGRLGYGLGFYDRALADAPGALAVGLAFACQVLARVPVDDHDVPMDLVVTEDRLITPPPRRGGT